CMQSRPPRLDDALRFFTAAQAVRPQNPYNIRRIIEVLTTKGNWDDAERWCRQGVRLFEQMLADSSNDSRYPDELAQMWRRLGLVQLRSQKLDDATNSFEVALRLSPRLAAAHLGLADVHRCRRAWEKSIARYEATIECAPEGPTAHRELAFLLANCSDE